MNNFTFVILHYKTKKDTIECIESIRNLTYKNISIVVVDNGSKNGSGEELLEKYRNIDNIYIIINEKNLGFAKGNNEGFKFAKYKLGAEYICLINNDTIIKQKDFVEKCMSIYDKEKYYILGPDVISLIDGKHQSPFGFHIFSLKAAIKDIIFNFINLIGFYIFIGDKLENFLKNRKKNLNKRIDNSKKTIIKNHILTDSVGMLNGCCIIFSPQYIKKYNGLYSKTFMYGEEAILFIINKELGNKMLYSSYIEIFHKEGSSTKSNYRGRKKGIFFYKNNLKSSLKIMYLLCKKNNIPYLEKQLR